MLLNVSHVKLINFRTPRVEGRLKYNALTSAQRRQFQINTGRWRPFTVDCHRLIETMRDLLCDWGTHLSVLLYEEALTSLCPNCEVPSRIELRREGNLLGTHAVNQHHPDAFFVVTAITNERSYESHLLRLLNLTRLKGLHWINLNHDQIEFVTLLANE